MSWLLGSVSVAAIGGILYLLGHATPQRVYASDVAIHLKGGHVGYLSVGQYRSYESMWATLFVTTLTQLSMFLPGAMADAKRKNYTSTTKWNDRGPPPPSLLP